MRVALVIAREQGGIGACETLPAGTWPALLAEYRIRAREAHTAAEAARHGTNKGHRHRAT